MNPMELLSLGDRLSSMFARISVMAVVAVPGFDGHERRSA